VLDDEMRASRPLMSRLRVLAVEDEGVLAAHAEAWSELLARSSSNRPTLAPFWILEWWRLFGRREGRRLAALLVFDRERLVGLAPLSRRVRWHRRAIPFRQIELLATGEREADEIVSDYVGVIAEAGKEEAVVDAVVDALMRGEAGTWDEILLTAMDAKVETNSLLRRALVGRVAQVQDLPTSTSPYIRLPARWEDYLAALPSSGRYLITRSIRDFDKWAGTNVTLERAKSPADIEEGRRILVCLHTARWQAAGRDGVFASEVFSSFHVSVLPKLLASGALDLVWLCVRGQPVAVAYNILWDNKVLFYQGGRTLDVPKGVRPGIVLHARLIKEAIEAGRTEYDFLAGSAQYKLQLSTAKHPLMALRASRAPVRELACRALERGIRELSARRAVLRAGLDLHEGSESLDA
jgi:CelD/BcsL family acetyltransferase involved in cellulose biosynthesis